MYQVRVLGEGRAVLAMEAAGVNPVKGESVSIAVVSIKSAAVGKKILYSGESAIVRKESVPVSAPADPDGVPYTMTVTNSSNSYLSPGDITCFDNGVYTGRGKFPGAEAGATAAVACSGP